MGKGRRPGGAGLRVGGRDDEERAVTQAMQQHYDSRGFDCMGELVLEEVRRGTLLGQVEKHFDPDRWHRVIDVGCGASARNVFFARRYWGQDVVALDLSWRTLVTARSRIRVPYVNANVLALPFADGAFDFVVSTGVIHHTANPRKALRELGRILSRGGGMFVSIYNRRSIYRLIYRYLGGLVRRLSGCGLGLLVRYVMVPLYALAYTCVVWASTGRFVRVPYRQAAADFDDKLLNPHALFHTAYEVRGWLEEQGLACLESSTHMAGMMLGFLVRG